MLSGCLTRGKDAFQDLGRASRALSDFVPSFRSLPSQNTQQTQSVSKGDGRKRLLFLIPGTLLAPSILHKAGAGFPKGDIEREEEK